MGLKSRPGSGGRKAQKQKMMKKGRVVIKPKKRKAVAALVTQQVCHGHGHDRATHCSRTQPRRWCMLGAERNHAAGACLAWNEIFDVTTKSLCGVWHKILKSGIPCAWETAEADERHLQAHPC